MIEIKNHSLIIQQFTHDYYGSKNTSSVLGYSLWDNLMRYKKQGVIHKITRH